MGRVILHCDANSFYASVEIAQQPCLRDKPVAVGGDASQRHGIILASNTIAKKNYGVKTTEAIWQAKQKCPELIVLPPRHALYAEVSQKLHALFAEYSDRVESFGLDEAWIDLSAKGATYVLGKAVAEEIRTRVKAELGITVSVGVADNKIMAKLGSDIRKPDAVTVITPENMRQLVWPLPVGDLLYVGPKTAARLQTMNIRTIGDLAQCSGALLEQKFGKNGLALKESAMGKNNEPVHPGGREAATQSISRMVTPASNLTGMEEVSNLFRSLSSDIASQLMAQQYKANCVFVGARTTDLHWTSCQKMLPAPTYFSNELYHAAITLFQERYGTSFPIRAASLGCSNLVDANAPQQMDMFGIQEKRMKEEKAALAMMQMKERFGKQSISQGAFMSIPLNEDK